MQIDGRHALKRRVCQVDVNLRPRLQPERASALVGAKAQQPFHGEHAAFARLATSDSLDLAQLRERVDADVRVGADAERDPAVLDARGGEKAVREVGLCRGARADRCTALLEQIQRDLFAVGARLADPSRRIAERVTKIAVGAAEIARLEGWIDALEATLTPLSRFILAGGSPAGAALHVARTTCRRAERAMVALRQADNDAFESELLVYVNRLSDLLFVMARAANHRAGTPEIEW